MQLLKADPAAGSPKGGHAFPGSAEQPSSGRDQKPSSPLPHHTSKLTIKGSMLKADTGSGQSAVADGAVGASGDTRFKSEGIAATGEQPDRQPAVGIQRAQGLGGPTNPGRNFGSMSAILNASGSSGPEAKQEAGAQAAMGNGSPRASVSGRPVPSSAKHGSRLNPSKHAHASKGEVQSPKLNGSTNHHSKEATAVKAVALTNGEAIAEPGKPPSAASNAGGAQTEQGDANSDQQPSLTVKTQPGRGHRKRKSATHIHSSIAPSFSEAL